MAVKTLLIEIFLSEHLTKTDLDLRHILVDTIESRGLGEVVEETSSPKAMEVIIEHASTKDVLEPIKTLLRSLGLDNFRTEYIDY